MPTLYLVKDDFEQTNDIVRQIDHAGNWVEQAVELMRIAGEEERANKIDDVWLRAYGRDPHILEAVDVKELFELLDGFEARLVGKVVDKEWMIREDQLPELRDRTSLGLDETRGAEAIYGVAEAMSRVLALRTILEQVITDSLRIVVG
jgi:hypothetical protein